MTSCSGFLSDLSPWLVLGRQFGLPSFVSGSPWSLKSRKEEEHTSHSAGSLTLPQPRGWCCPLSGRVFPLQLKQSRPLPSGMPSGNLVYSPSFGLSLTIKAFSLSNSYNCHLFYFLNHVYLLCMFVLVHTHAPICGGQEQIPRVGSFLPCGHWGLNRPPGLVASTVSHGAILPATVSVPCTPGASDFLLHTACQPTVLYHHAFSQSAFQLPSDASILCLSPGLGSSAPENKSQGSRT